MYVMYRRMIRHVENTLHGNKADRFLVIEHMSPFHFELEIK